MTRPRPVAKDFDAVVVGGGHNGLTCAAYLAGAGLSVCVLERRAIVGGAAVTEEFHPGFRNSTASYTVSLLDPKVIGDLRLAEHGLRIVERPLANFLPLSERRDDFIEIGGGIEATTRQVARHSAKDAQRLPSYYAMIECAAEVVRALATTTPPNRFDGVGGLLDAWRTFAPFRRLDTAVKADLCELFTKSAGDVLDRWFGSTPVKAAFGFDAIVGNFASPYTPGTAYTLLHYAIGEVNGKRGQWGHALGGMGAITQAMARECESRGVAIRTGAAVEKVDVVNGRAIGVTLADGNVVRARRVVANVNPKLLFTKLVDRAHVPEDFQRRIDAYRCASGTLRMNVALSALPVFAAKPGVGPHLASGIVIAPSLDYMERAYFDAKTNGWSRAPVVEMLIPSLVDDSLAPPGQHVASLFCQHVHPDLASVQPGRSWDDAREEVADVVIDTVDRFAPGFESSVIARKTLTPLDLERDFGLMGGDIAHGTMSLDQLFFARPVFGSADYRTPVRGLYLCGAGAHPGGGVSGLPGHNAAREILRDVARHRG
ncbi:MAG TPA: NAD(P)/FAD-dependent oxidoreductase [Casimicrobiaceae bacterium]|nr:NAD(P)/FAD-dependent oxidoreductase [Casimicrobiaceae bacterium]